MSKAEFLPAGEVRKACILTWNFKNRTFDRSVVNSVKQGTTVCVCVCAWRERESNVTEAAGV